jgi:hypothetical protein
MPKFAVKLYNDLWAKQRVGKLFREGKCLLTEFIDEIKKDKNLEPELGDLFAILKYVADGEKPLPPISKYRKLNLGGKSPYTGYEAKSASLRIYLFHDPDTGLVLVIGGKKVDQDKGIERLKKIIREYQEYKTKNKIELL